MPVPFQRPRALVLLLALTTAACALAAAFASGAMASHGSLYTQTNDPAGNAVQRFDRAADGSLAAAGTYATGGRGLAGLGGRQGAVELSDDGRHVLAVNAGSDTVSVFKAKPNRLKLLGTVASGGSAPVSVDEQHGRVYVLNSGGTPSVTAFARGGNGGLVEIGRRELAPGASGVAQQVQGGRIVRIDYFNNRPEALEAAGLSK